jgi:hypothetical protein
MTIRVAEFGRRTYAGFVPGRVAFPPFSVSQLT